MMLH
jgi:hypothetical protein